jgi:hypothetical protein
VSYPTRQQAARQGFWTFLVKRDDMPNVPFADIAAIGGGVLVQPDDPDHLDVLADAMKFGCAPGLWVPDRDGETEASYITRVKDAIDSIAARKLGPWRVVLNPEHNAIGTTDWRTAPGAPKPRWWTWLDTVADTLKATYTTRLFTTSIPAQQDFVNWPAVFRLGDASLQLYGGSDGSIRFDPTSSLERLRRNSYMDPADVDPRRVTFDVGSHHTDWYLEPVNGIPRIAQAGLRGLSLWSLDEDWMTLSFKKYQPLVQNGVLALRAA